MFRRLLNKILERVVLQRQQFFDREKESSWLYLNNIPPAGSTGSYIFFNLLGTFKYAAATSTQMIKRANSNWDMAQIT